MWDIHFTATIVKMFTYFKYQVFQFFKVILSIPDTINKVFEKYGFLIASTSRDPVTPIYIYVYQYFYAFL